MTIWSNVKIVGNDKCSFRFSDDFMDYIKKETGQLSLFYTLEDWLNYDSNFAKTLLRALGEYYEYQKEN